MTDKELNLVEILKDSPKGTELYSPAYGECELGSINTRHDKPIQVFFKSKYGESAAFFTWNGKIAFSGEYMLFPSKDNRDWGTFNVRQNFKKGDFVARVYYDGYATILLMGETDWSSQNNPVRYICYVDVYGGDFHVSQSTNCCWCSVNAFYDDDRYRLATDDEKKKLLDAIDKHGYLWDEEKLELRKKEYEFKTFDKVLVRHYEENTWRAGLFSHIEYHEGRKYYCANGEFHTYCIPYEGNEHLLGTTDSPDEKGGEQ